MRFEPECRIAKELLSFCIISPANEPVMHENHVPCQCRASTSQQYCASTAMPHLHAKPIPIGTTKTPNTTKRAQFHETCTFNNIYSLQTHCRTSRNWSRGLVVLWYIPHAATCRCHGYHGRRLAFKSNPPPVCHHRMQFSPSAFLICRAATAGTPRPSWPTPARTRALESRLFVPLLVL